MTEPKTSLGNRLLFYLLLVPGLLQLVLLCTAMFGRVRYPYDLEWMEGGILHHALRIAEGQGIYVEPSVDFIPFLYTPLYPGLMAMLSGLFDISYGFGRAISIVATLGICVLLLSMVRSEFGKERRGLAWLGGLSAIGLFCATYPWVEGWYDLVRADSLFLLMVVGGLYGIRSWAKSPGNEGLAKVGSVAALLGLSFFAKQTGVLFVAAGGAMLLVLNWRRVPLYVGVTGVIGLGGTWLLNKVTNGWFWIYVYKTHQNHDFSMDRFYRSFGYILWHFPAATVVIALGVLVLLATLIRKRRLPAGARGFAVWLPVYALAVLVGAIGWGTQFAHFNAYIPAMTFGALSAGLAIPAIVECLDLWFDEGHKLRRHTLRVGQALAIALGVQLLLSWWTPTTFIPSERDHKAGHELIRTLKEQPGDVLIPYHPWYAHLAGKKPQVHLMGLRDMTTGKVWPIRGLKEMLSGQQYSAVVFDNRPVGRELSLLQRYYRMDDYLPETASPHVYTGAGAVWNRKHSPLLIPRSLWLPNKPLQRPDGVEVLWDFETGNLEGWTSKPMAKKRGKRHNKGNLAWGRRPVSRPLKGQGAVRRYGGRYYLSSFHGGDKSTGALISPDFIIEGSSISFRLSGGNNPEKLRAELWIEDQLVRSATGTNSERMEDVSWNVAGYSGKPARIVLVDESDAGWGHLNADEFWVHQ